MMNVDIFRREALAHHAGEQRHGDLLRFETRITRWTFRVILAAALAAFVYVVFFDVSEYSAGIAMVRLEGRRAITATIAGTVEAVHVQPGQHVKKGQVLVTLSAVMEEAEMRRANAEFELNLAELLRNPGDPNVKHMLVSSKPRRDVAREFAAARVVRAPDEGVITDVRIRPGQHLGVGELALGIAPVDAPATLVCILPGDTRPMLAAGQDVRFSLDGYRFEYRTVTVSSVGEEVVGPMEMRRYLGLEVGDAIPIQGASVIVKAKLPTRTFDVDGKTYSYVEGLTGTADVRVRSEPLIVVLLPALKALRPTPRS